MKINRIEDSSILQLLNLIEYLFGVYGMLHVYLSMHVYISVLLYYM